MQAATAASAHQRKHQHCDPLGVDAGEFGGFRIAADSVDVAAETGAPGEERHHDPRHQRDQHRNRVAGRDEEAAFGNGDVVLLGIARGDALRPRISVDDRGRADDEKAPDAADQVLRPHRPLRKAEPRPPLPAGIKAEDDGGAGERAERPTRRGADRTVRAAAHQGEAVVERAMVCPVVTHQAAPRQNNCAPSVTMKAGMPR